MRRTPSSGSSASRVSAVEFDRPFQALDYRLAEAGEAGPGRSLGRIPVHSLVTEPADGEALRAGRATIHGVAWSGAGPVAAVDVRIDRGAWTPATITSRTGAYGRALWALDWDADGGRHVIAVRARDASGDAQPGEPVWNRRGYANCIHRITVVVEEGPDGHVRT